MRKFILAALVVSSCSRQSHWTTDQMHSEQKEHRSAKLCYLCKDPIHGIDLEFLRTHDHLKVYLNVHSMPVPAHQGDPKSALVKLSIDSEVLRCQAYRLEGGQRLLLSDEIAEMLIEALKNNREVTVTLSGYRSVVKAEDFAAKFDQLQHPFSWQNPFHLPM